MEGKVPNLFKVQTVQKHMPQHDVSAILSTLNILMNKVDLLREGQVELSKKIAEINSKIAFHTGTPSDEKGHKAPLHDPYGF